MTGQIIHKPLGVSIPQDILDKAKSNNNYGFAVAYSKKEGKTLWHGAAQKDTNFSKIDDWNHIISPNAESVFYFVGSLSIKVDEFPFHDIRDDKNWLWYASEGICPLLNSSNEPYVLYKCFLEPLSFKGSCDLLAHVAKNHSLGRLVVIKRGLVERLGTWKESDGIFFSNEDHLKKPYSYNPPAYNSHPYSGHSSTSHSQKELPINYPTVNTIPMKLSIGESSIGMRNYFGVSHTYKYYVDDVFDNSMIEAGLMPMDFIMSIRTKGELILNPIFSDIEKAVKSEQPFSLSIERFDLDKNKSCVTVDIPGKTSNKLKAVQRDNIIETLLGRKIRRENPSFTDMEIAACVDAFKDKGCEYSNVSDEHLIQAAETEGINFWKNL